MQDDYSSGPDSRLLRRTGGRDSCSRIRPVASQNVETLTITVVVPAHNEGENLGATLDALLRQTDAPDRIVVVDDGSTDRTSEVAAEYPVELVRNDKALGQQSQGRQLRHARDRHDLGINVDGDTILADDYIERVKVPFANDPQVSVVAGLVLTQEPLG